MDSTDLHSKLQRIKRRLRSNWSYKARTTIGSKEDSNCYKSFYISGNCYSGFIYRKTIEK